MSKRETVLVIENDVDIATVTCLRLELAGYTASTCRDRQTGFRVAIDQCPDVILLGSPTREASGIDAVAELSLCKDIQAIPVIAFSVNRDTRRQAFDMGVRRYVDEPYNSLSLIAAIKRVIADARRVSRERTDSPQRSRKHVGQIGGKLVKIDSRHAKKPHIKPVNISPKSPVTEMNVLDACQ